MGLPIDVTWEVLRRRSTAAEFHATPIPDPATPQVWVHEITRPALVLGSTQRDDVVDRRACERRGVDVVRRRSGGGAVLLVPDEVVWVDVIMPAGSVGWSDDIHRPMVWLGEHLAAACSVTGVSAARVHDGAMVTTEHSRLVCFDGLGPGEITLGGHKLVGISQRRTRGAARMQCCWYRAYEPSDLTSLLAVEVDPSVLRPVATLDSGRANGIVDALAAALPTG